MTNVYTVYNTEIKITRSRLRIVAICVSRANLSLMVQVVTVVRYATRDRSSLSNCSPPSYMDQQKMCIHYVYSDIFIKRKKISNMMLKMRRSHSKRKPPFLTSPSSLVSLINHCWNLMRQWMWFNVQGPLCHLVAELSSSPCWTSISAPSSPFR